MKTKTTLFIILCISLVFSGCFSPWAGEEQGKLIVSIGGGNGQARGVYFNGNDTDDFLHIITITGFGRKQEARFVGSGTASFFVPTGRWNIEVKAYDVRQLYDRNNLDVIDVVALYLPLVADGSADVNVKIGDNSVSIKMGLPGRDRIPPPSDEEFTITLMLGGGEYTDVGHKVYFVATGIYYVYVPWGEDYVLREPKRQGYAFLGWFTDKDKDKGELITIVDKNYYGITLYAKWVEKVAGASTLKIGVIRGQDGKTLTLEKWGTVTIESPNQTDELLANEGYYYSWEMVNIPKGTEIRIKAAPYNGYDFVEWRDNYLFDKSKNISNLEEYNFDIQENTTLYAVFQEKNTINITSVADLKKIADQTEPNSYPLNGNYNLMADLDFSTLSGNWTPIGNETAPFTGTFNGMGHTVNLKNIGTVGTTTKYTGLFGRIGSDGKVKNLKLTGSVIVNSEKTIYAGAVAGYNEGNIANVVTYVNLDINFINGISTELFELYAGGIAGVNFTSTINNCVVIGNINGTSNNDSCNARTGGIVGQNTSSGSIKYCLASGKIEGKNYGGGIAGITGNGARINNCVALNTEILSAIAGRIVGNENGILLQDNYALPNMFVNGVLRTDTETDTIDGADFNNADIAANWVNSGPKWNGGNSEDAPWQFWQDNYSGSSPRPMLWFENNLGYE